MARKVFLSFTMEDKDSVNLFRIQAESRQSALVFRDYPIKEAFEYAWKTNAERLIRSCNVTVCLIGKTTYQSKAVDWEIRKSAELGKYIMAVAIESPTPVLPPSLAELNVSPLAWNMEKIVGELYGIGTAYSRARTSLTATIGTAQRY